MKIGIVGSRNYPNLDRVVSFVKSLPKGTVVISGGAIGVDYVAVQTARECGLQVIEHFPDLNGCEKYYEFCKAYDARNKLIAQDCDELVAFTVDPRSGGTSHTIKFAKALGKKITIIK